MFTDTHCHIYNEYYDNTKEVIEAAKINGISRMINCGCDIKTNEEVLNMCESFHEMYGAIGIHPENVNDYTNQDLEFIRNAIRHDKVVAIGEIGLDYHYTKENREEQISLFESQLKIAEENNMSIVIHSREATDDMLKILKKNQLKGVMHSFSGSLETALEYIKMGYLLGINGVVTFKNCKLKEFLINIPLDNIILETDSPYLTPEPLRGHKNEPANIKYIAEFVANLYGITLEELSKITNANIKRIFDI